MANPREEFPGLNDHLTSIEVAIDFIKFHHSIGIGDAETPRTETLKLMDSIESSVRESRTLVAPGSKSPK